MRLDKYIAYALGKTRGEARKIIANGEIKVNNQVMRKNDWTVNEYQDEIKHLDEIITYKQFIYIMLNKPKGYLSATKDERLPTIRDLVSEYAHYDLFMVGRLDLDSEGLIIMTNDGKFAHRITSPKKNVAKKYYVIVNKEFVKQDIHAFEEGLFIYDGNKNLFKTKPSQLEIISEHEAFITIYEGKYHQVKKMCLKQGKEVTYLKRIQIGNVSLDPQLAAGEYRLLTQAEKASLENC
ncbi:MAG: pseudouridine synthase [Bacilli bacterium]